MEFEKPVRARLELRLAAPSPHADEAPDFDEEAFLQSLSKAAGAFFVVSLFGSLVLAQEKGEAPTAVFDNVPKEKFAEVPSLAHSIAQNVPELFLFLTLDTPYRGCLVYARAAAAIAAQCIKSTAPIVVVSKNTGLKHAALKLALNAAGLVAWEKKDGWRRKAGPVVSLPILDKQAISMTVRAEMDRVVFLDPTNPPSSVDGKVVVLDNAHELCRTLAQSKFYTTLTTAKNCKILALAQAPTFDNGAQLSVLLNVLRGETAYYTCKSAPTEEDVLRTVLSCAESDGLFYVVRTPEGYVNSAKGLVKGVDDADFKKKMGKCVVQTKLPFDNWDALTPAEMQRRAQGLVHKPPLKTWEPQTVVHGVAQAPENTAFPTAAKGDDAVHLLNAQGAFDSALRTYNPKFYAALQEMKKNPLQTHLVVTAAAALFEQVLRKNGYAGEVANYVYEDAAALATLPSTTTVLLFSAVPTLHKGVDHAHFLEPVNPQRVDCGALHYYLYKNAKEPTADEGAYENLKKQAVINAALFKLL